MMAPINTLAYPGVVQSGLNSYLSMANLHENSARNQAQEALIGAQINKMENELPLAEQLQGLQMQLLQQRVEGEQLKNMGLLAALQGQPEQGSSPVMEAARMAEDYEHVLSQYGEGSLQARLAGAHIESTFSQLLGGEADPSQLVGWNIGEDGNYEIADAPERGSIFSDSLSGEAQKGPDIINKGGYWYNTITDEITVPMASKSENILQQRVLQQQGSAETLDQIIDKINAEYADTTGFGATMGSFFGSDKSTELRKLISGFIPSYLTSQGNTNQSDGDHKRALQLLTRGKNQSVDSYLGGLEKIRDDLYDSIDEDMKAMTIGIPVRSAQQVKNLIAEGEIVATPDLLDAFNIGGTVRQELLAAAKEKTLGA